MCLVGVAVIIIMIVVITIIIIIIVIIVFITIIMIIIITGVRLWRASPLHLQYWQGNTQGLQRCSPV